jgi:RNA polymerase sigma-70 factor (ECF subfamily)
LNIILRHMPHNGRQLVTRRMPGITLEVEGVGHVDAGEFDLVLQQAGSGSEGALSRLYAEYNRMLVRYLRVHAPGAGEDLAQETWLAVAPRLRTFRGTESDFRVFLLREARGQAAEYRHNAQSDPARPFAPRSLNAMRRTDVGDEPVADAALATLLDGLRPLHAEILLLRVVGGLTAEEAGALLGKSPGMIRVTQHRVLRQLAKRLGSEPIPR